MPTDREIKVGDWVRFYDNGAQVIGEVRCISRHIAGYPYIQTDKGEVRVDRVVEVRGAD